MQHNSEIQKPPSDHHLVNAFQMRLKLQPHECSPLFLGGGSERFLLQAACYLLEIKVKEIKLDCGLQSQLEGDLSAASQLKMAVRESWPALPPMRVSVSKQYRLQMHLLFAFRYIRTQSLKLV